jgi:hypothetical protein
MIALAFSARVTRLLSKEDISKEMPGRLQRRGIVAA